MTHRNAPLTPEGRRRAVQQVLGGDRPVSHVAAEFRISRATLSKWVNRYRREGPSGLQDVSSAPANRPTRLPAWVIELIESWRREHKWTARRITHELLHTHGYRCAVRTVTRWLDRLGLNRLRDITPAGDTLRAPGRITARYPGHMVHMDVKKIGRLRDGGGWWAHGRGSAQDRARHPTRVGYTYLHSMGDGFSRLAYAEVLDDQTAATTIGFFHRARVFFASHGITRITRLVTDNGPNYTARSFTRTTRAFIARHQRIRPYTPRHNGKVERYQRLLADECLYARPYASESDRSRAITIWVNHYNYHRPHTACHDQPPATRTPKRVNNVMTNYI
ncbi:IS481 family transposase [Kytococcus sp. Marseille-QA3725]